MTRTPEQKTAIVNHLSTILFISNALISAVIVYLAAQYINPFLPSDLMVQGIFAPFVCILAWMALMGGGAYVFLTYLSPACARWIES